MDTNGVPVSLSPADILRNAANYLQRHGWTQGAFYANLHQPSPPACALGAIAITTYGEVRTDPIVEDGAMIRTCG